jgi:hypothetical protein
MTQNGITEVKVYTVLNRNLPWKVEAQDIKLQAMNYKM